MASRARAKFSLTYHDRSVQSRSLTPEVDGVYVHKEGRSRPFVFVAVVRVVAVRREVEKGRGAAQQSVPERTLYSLYLRRRMSDTRNGCTARTQGSGLTVLAPVSWNVYHGMAWIGGAGGRVGVGRGVVRTNAPVILKYQNSLSPSLL